jgi:hypothetical protein
MHVVWSRTNGGPRLWSTHRELKEARVAAGIMSRLGHPVHIDKQLETVGPDTSGPAWYRRRS